MNKRIRDIIATNSALAASTGVAGAISIGVDMITLGPIWINLMSEVLNEYEIHIPRKRLLVITQSVMNGLFVYISGSNILIKTSLLIPLINENEAIAFAGKGFLNYIYTNKFGNAIVKYLEEESRDFNTSHISEISQFILREISTLPKLNDINSMMKKS